MIIRAWIMLCCMLLLGTYPARALDTVNVANVSRTLFSLPLWIGMEKGYFKQERLNVTSRILNNAEFINAQLKAGEVQIAMGTPEAVIIDAYKGGSLRVIAGNAGKLPHFIITKPSIKSLSDLRGANFGVLSDTEGTTYIVQDIAKFAGLGPKDYRMTAVGGAPTRWQLLKEGKIDAGLQPFPLSYEAEAAGFNNLGAAAEIVPEWQFTTINADGNWAKSNRDIVVRFLKALQLGRDFMDAHVDESAAIAARELKTTTELAKRALVDAAKMQILNSRLDVTDPGLRKVFETLKMSGEIDKSAAFDLARFTDLNYLRESRRQQ